MSGHCGGKAVREKSQTFLAAMGLLAKEWIAPAARLFFKDQKPAETFNKRVEWGAWAPYVDDLSGSAYLANAAFECARADA